MALAPDIRMSDVDLRMADKVPELQGRWMVALEQADSVSEGEDTVEVVEGILGREVDDSSFSPVAE